ncbi:lysozyme [Erythrobacter aurantius]|uniref:lysozyme n=1 Tax=Erythrobacter aurantius TaxID=2909249 RepID=UPI002079EEE5|nr:lysozyme [Erythrobacter aurantius]
MTYTPSPTLKPVFDAVRRMLGRGFRPAEVDALDQALDPVLLPEGDTSGDNDDTPAFLPEDSVPCVPSVPHIRRSERNRTQSPRTVGDAGIALIKRFEGCARLRRDGLVEAYPDPGTGGAPWTIGWGATRGGLHGFVTAETVWTQEQCDERLVDDLARYAAEVERAIGDAPTTQAQFDALVSFHYNTGAIARATLTRKHRAGDYAGATAEFARWNRAGGRVLKGLVRRRAEEAKLYHSAQ